MKFAPELRERIYAFALASDRAILPHLCDNTTDKVTFHDDNQQQQHDSVHKLLGITRVSKQIRKESFPVFYSANTFEVGSDTVTYFARLEHLGRFHMIRHVDFKICMYKETRAGGILRDMNQYIKMADAYEKSLLGSDMINALLTSKLPAYAQNEHPPTNSAAFLIGSNFTTLTEHPQYHAGGTEELSTLITLQKLTSTFTSPAATSSSSSSSLTTPKYTSKLVLPVPRASIFEEYASLKWFPNVCYGLGMRLHLLDNVPLTHTGSGFITVTWHQRYQKKDFSAATTTGASSEGGVHGGGNGAGVQTEVYKRAIELFPDLEKMARPTQTSYHRSDCKRTGITWYTMPTEGGGVSG
ncbi:hypothetical protein N0V83_007227 [Neocucurbitaria cava]|uniref:Uncharacterized protein n=1 Tax=Neocucurbitaria cava TaxID=798079 RepID=A0A9W8Y781_9PLEO|nr:hypothetical protein N0V83_007227 [Neocucurbitaria cava]